MKRSEMVILLTNSIEYHLSDIVGDELTERVLSDIEKTGMLPPERPLREEESAVIYTHTWEPEDD